MGSVISRKRNQYDLKSADSSKNMSSNTENDFIDAVLCKETDLPDNSLKAFEVDGGKVLLVKSEGVISAIGNKCTHYGAPLEKGALCGNIVRCPFHGACFNIKTGDIEDFPGLDKIPTYDVRIENGDVKVRAKRSLLKNSKVVKKMVKRDKSNNESYVIVGGGAAGAKCVETIRQEGFTGRVVLISAEDALPYERIKLSKVMHQDAASIALRSKEFYEEADIETILGDAVCGVDTNEKVVNLSSGTKITYNKLLLATGGRPRSLGVPGSDLKGIFVLRSPTDANQICESAKGKHVVVVGTSFIGMEVAAYLSGEDRCLSVTVLGRSSIPFEQSLGSEIGARIQQLFEEKGVTIINNASVSEIVGSDGNVEKVVLNSGEEYPCSVVVAGVGVVPSTEFLEDSPIERSSRGFVNVDKHMETSVPGVFCAGDIAQFPLFLHDESVSIGHWQMAHSHGHIAGLNMSGKETEIRSVPFFWTMLYGKSFRYAGHGKFDHAIVSGDLSGLSFVTYYCQGSKVVALASMGKDPAAAKYANYLKIGKFLTRDEVEEDPDVVFKLPC